MKLFPVLGWNFNQTMQWEEAEIYFIIVPDRPTQNDYSSC